MKRANTMSTITVELTIKVKTKFTSSKIFTRMGSMANVNTAEKTLEANKGVNQVAGVPVVAGNLPEVAGEHAAMPNPTSPPAGKGDKPMRLT